MPKQERKIEKKKKSKKRDRELKTKNLLQRKLSKKPHQLPPPLKLLQVSPRTKMPKRKHKEHN